MSIMNIDDVWYRWSQRVGGGILDAALPVLPVGFLFVSFYFNFNSTCILFFLFIFLDSMLFGLVVIVIDSIDRVIRHERLQGDTE
jgi:hypothetical protein